MHAVEALGSESAYRGLGEIDPVGKLDVEERRLGPADVGNSDQLRRALADDDVTTIERTRGHRDVQPVGPGQELEALIIVPAIPVPQIPGP